MLTRAGLFASGLNLWIPRHEAVEGFRILGLDGREILEEVFEVGGRAEPVGLGGFDHGVDDGAGRSAVWCVGEEPVLASDGERADGALDAVVIEFEPAIEEEAEELGPIGSGSS